MILVGFAQTLPSEYTIEVIEVMDAKPEAVYGKIGNLKEWPSWSPWKQEDPSMTFDFSKMKETIATTGDSFSWKGKNSGTVKITEASTNSLLRYELSMPGMSPSTFFFSIGEGTDEGKTNTTLYWSARGTRTATEKIFWRYLGLESELKNKMATGLANIRTQVEKK